MYNLKPGPSKYVPSSEEMGQIQYKHSLETTGNLLPELIKLSKSESGLKKIKAAFRREHLKEFRDMHVTVPQLQPILSEIMGELVENRQVQRFITDVQWTHTDRITVEDFLERLKVVERFHMDKYFVRELTREVSSWATRGYLQTSTQPRCNHYGEVGLLRARNETHAPPEHKTFNKYLNY